MNKKSLLVLLLLAAMLTACSTPAATVTTDVAATEAPIAAETAAPVETSAPEPVTLTVFAAASLTDAFTEIGTAFQAQYPNVTISFNFAGSQALASQIVEGAPVDVFASANNSQMQVVVDAGLIPADTATAFVHNSLVIVTPADNPAGIDELADLAQPGLTLVFAADTVPAGKYTIDLLTNANATLGETFSASVLANVVSYEDNVRSVLSKVELGEADAGVVYLSDSVTSTSIQVIEIPDDMNVIATYPIATVSASANADYAQAFVDFIYSTEAQEILTRYGFISVAR
ncbi:MAG TPA: molybdate ABC transporter substrate-binding protein [Longilinea sp.]|nr:molybdate ABC transporter substrate-binding protein [Longilinea sp.]